MVDALEDGGLEVVALFEVVFDFLDSDATPPSPGGQCTATRH